MKLLRIGGVKNLSFFWVCHFEFFFASSPWKLATNYVLEWMELNFQYYDGLQPKIRAGIINEHECTTSSWKLKSANMAVPGLYVLKNTSYLYLRSQLRHIGIFSFKKPSWSLIWNATSESMWTYYVWDLKLLCIWNNYLPIQDGVNRKKKTCKYLLKRWQVHFSFCFG